ncbi:MAG: aminomethyl transferase family protein [Thermoleophilia bacterium]|nr:aminomethyl transferase family protein [Thermoleophilia bacterium]
MSSLDFLSPDRARVDLGFSPVLRSSLERAQREHGAAFEERDGWLVATSFPGESERLAACGLVDLSHLGKVEVRGSGEAEESRDILTWYRIRPDRSLVLTAYRDVFLTRSTLARRFPLVLDQTAALGVLALVGPQAPRVLGRMTHLHELPASGMVSHVPAHVLDRGASGTWIVFPQEYGHHLYEVALDAVEPLGGGPAGADALEVRSA